MAKNTPILAVVILIVGIVVLALLFSSYHGTGSVNTNIHMTNLPFVNVTSVSVSFDNLSTIGSYGIPASSQISQSYSSFPVNVTPIFGVNVPAGQNITINVTTSYTFNGQSVRFISQTPGFSVLNSTYLYSNETYLDLNTSTISFTTTSSTVPTSSVTAPNSTTTSTIPAPENATTTISPNETVVPAGSAVQYMIHLSTPASGYYGNVQIIEVINDVDRTGIIISNRSS